MRFLRGTRVSQPAAAEATRPKTFLDDSGGGTRPWIATALAGLVLYLVVAGALSLTKRPWADEAWYANVSFSEMTAGNTGVSVLDPRGDGVILGRELPQIDREYCLWLPAQQTVQVPWYRVFGFSLTSIRAASMLWGLVALLAWFTIVAKVTRDGMAAALTIVFVSCDYAFVNAASDGRMDMMCASLWFLAVAVYLALRERRLGLAIFFSQCLVVASMLVHPMGLAGLVVILILTLYLDFRRLRWSHLGLACLAFLAGGSLAALYVLPNLSLCRAQFLVALTQTHRLGLLQSPLGTPLREFTEKIASFYAPADANGLLRRLRVLIPLIYGAVFVAACISSPTRRFAGRVLLLAGASFAVMAFYDSAKLPYYIVHYSPAFAAAVAVWLRQNWKGRMLPRLAAGSVAAGLVLLQIGWVGFGVRRDNYHKSFLPMTRFLEAHLCQTCAVIGSGEIGFELGFDSRLKDDALLGYYSGRRADLIVTDGMSYESHFKGFEMRAPAIAAHIQRLLGADYRKIFDDGYYKIYARK